MGLFGPQREGGRGGRSGWRRWEEVSGLKKGLWINGDSRHHRRPSADCFPRNTLVVVRLTRAPRPPGPEEELVVVALQLRVLFASPLKYER